MCIFQKYADVTIDRSPADEVTALTPPRASDMGARVLMVDPQGSSGRRVAGERGHGLDVPPVGRGVGTGVPGHGLRTDAAAALTHPSGRARQGHWVSMADAQSSNACAFSRKCMA